jgi:hypothetical protein
MPDGEKMRVTATPIEAPRATDLGGPEPTRRVESGAAADWSRPERGKLPETFTAPDPVRLPLATNDPVGEYVPVIGNVAVETNPELTKFAETGNLVGAKSFVGDNVRDDENPTVAAPVLVASGQGHIGGVGSPAEILIDAVTRTQGWNSMSPSKMHLSSDDSPTQSQKPTK